MWRLHLPSLRAFEPHFQLRMASGFQACYVPLVEDDDFDKQMDGLQGPSGLPATKPLTIRIPARAMINMRIPSIPADEGILVDEDMIDGIPSEDGPGGTLTAGLSTSAPTKSSPRRTPARRGRRSYSGALAQSRADQSYPDVFQSISCSPGIRGWSFEVRHTTHGSGLIVYNSCTGTALRVLQDKFGRDRTIAEAGSSGRPAMGDHPAHLHPLRSTPARNDRRTPRTGFR